MTPRGYAWLVGSVLALAGAAVAQWVTGGRGAFGGWVLDARERSKRRRRIERRFPVLGRWLLPAGYAVAFVGVAMMLWGGLT